MRYLIIAAAALGLGACASMETTSPEGVKTASTKYLCDTYYYAWPRSQAGAQRAKAELIERGESKCVDDAERKSGGKS